MKTTCPIRLPIIGSQTQHAVAKSQLITHTGDAAIHVPAGLQVGQVLGVLQDGTVGGVDLDCTCSGCTGAGNCTCQVFVVGDTPVGDHLSLYDICLSYASPQGMYLADTHLIFPQTANDLTGTAAYSIALNDSPQSGLNFVTPGNVNTYQFNYAFGQAAFTEQLGGYDSPAFNWHPSATDYFEYNPSPAAVRQAWSWNERKLWWTTRFRNSIDGLVGIASTMGTLGGSDALSNLFKQIYVYNVKQIPANGHSTLNSLTVGEDLNGKCLVIPSYAQLNSGTKITFANGDFIACDADPNYASTATISLYYWRQVIGQSEVLMYYDGMQGVCEYPYHQAAFYFNEVNPGDFVITSKTATNSGIDVMDMIYHVVNNADELL